ncbi:MAG: 2-phospho-L-lactate guanylyltransferase [Sphingomonadales bacterium]|nr:2-phospho-L-lactate guanylyltransferase [Sphingomonadales bacterium]
MSCWLFIPVKPPETAKLRLSGVLDEAARARLVRSMLNRVVTAARGADHVSAVCLIGPSRHGQGEDLVLLDDPGHGLNPALDMALIHGHAHGADRVIVVAGDLPQITAQDLQLLAMVPQGKVGIAPDRHGTGTNALSLPLPDARLFAFAFGPDSCARHHDEASRLGLGVEVIHSPGLSRDIDVPADLPDAAHFSGD